MKERQWNMIEFYNWEKSSRDILDVKRAYIDMAGDVCAGLILSELVYWNLPSKNGTNRMRVFRDNEWWVAVKRYEWYDRIRLTPDQADRAIGILLDKKLIVKARYKFAGNPVVHLRINETVFMDSWKKVTNEEYINPYKPAEINSEREGGSAKSNSPNGEIQLADSRVPLTETTTENTINYSENLENEFSEQSIKTSESSSVSSSGEKRKACPPIPSPDNLIDQPVIDKPNGFGALIPTTPGGILLFDKLKEEAHAKGHRAPVRFSSIAQRDAFLVIEKRIGGDLGKAIDYTLRQGITSVKQIVNYLDKWGTQPNNGRKTNTGYIHQNTYPMSGVLPTGKVVNEDGSLNI